MMTTQEKQRARKIELKKSNLEDMIVAIDEKIGRLNYQKEQIKEQVERLVSEKALLEKQDETISDK